MPGQEFWRDSRAVGSGSGNIASDKEDGTAVAPLPSRSQLRIFQGIAVGGRVRDQQHRMSRGDCGFMPAFFSELFSTDVRYTES